MDKKCKIVQKKIAPLQYSAINEFIELNGGRLYIEKLGNYKPKTLFLEPGFANVTPLMLADLSTLRETLERYL